MGVAPTSLHYQVLQSLSFNPQVDAQVIPGQGGA